MSKRLILKASECKCCICGNVAVAFWPNIDPDIPSHPQFQQSLRAWDSLTRDQKSLVRLDGSNLAQENIKYITHPVTEFEPAIYLEIPKNLTENEGL